MGERVSKTTEIEGAERNAKHFYRQNHDVLGSNLETRSIGLLCKEEESQCGEEGERKQEAYWGGKLPQRLPKVAPEVLVILDTDAETNCKGRNGEQTSQKRQKKSGNARSRGSLFESEINLHSINDSTPPKLVACTK